MASGHCRNEPLGNIREPECLVVKRPGKPDTGNPFVRFDEERGGRVELTTTVGLTRFLPLRLLYHPGGTAEPGVVPGIFSCPVMEY